MNAIFEEGGDVSTSKVNEKGVGQIDVTYNLAEGFYVTVFTIDALQFRIDKRISLIFACLSVRSRLEAGVASHFPDSNRIENVNRQLKSYLERRRRTLDQAINLLIEQLESVAGSLRMAPSGGGYHETMDALDLSRFPSLSVSREVSKLPEVIWPVPCGEHRYALDKKMLEWNVQPVERGYRLSNAEGRLVGLTVLDEGELRCTAIECSKMRSLCVHRLRVISLVPGSCTKSSAAKSRLTKQVVGAGGTKPGFKRNVRRRGEDRPEVLALRIPHPGKVTVDASSPVNVSLADEWNEQIEEEEHASIGPVNQIEDSVESTETGPQVTFKFQDPSEEWRKHTQAMWSLSPISTASRIN
ncbi:hypothetical protein PMAYCL1PPCAC_11855 [Pristionchus mayeri]|uniref:Uncharacterized protein n=1 Tax=Pristionchus mayeri TaxID=1317129 RepID=A0AAN5CGJ5_9BILA|nr:hypothetical protein PMAYCL1PPCAC_11855 [Pristionchus mayeri]